MAGLAILLGFHLLGVLLQAGLGVPVPANVIGLILFTTALFLKWIKLEWVESSAQFLLKHMMLFFAPIIVGTMAFAAYFKEQLAAILVSVLLGTVATILLTGWATGLMERRRGEKGAENNGRDRG